MAFGHSGGGEEHVVEGHSQGQLGDAEIDHGNLDATTPAFVFSHDPNHDDALMTNDDDSAHEAKRADMTKTFFQAFFDYPTINAQDYQVLVDEIDFLYDNVVPRRFRQRKQERAKYRLNELREALQRSSDEAAGILPPPPPPVPADHHGGVHEAPPAPLPEKSRKRRKIEFDKKAWTRRERTRSYWLGMRGPFFAAHSDAFQKLEKLVGHSFPHLNDQSFRAAWEREVARRQHAATLLLSTPKASTSNKSTPSNPNAPHHFVHFVFDVPGVVEEPKFTFSKATRKWQLEGTRSSPGVHYLTQLRAAGQFVVRGTLPASVDVNAVPKSSFGNGVLHITIADHVE
ncbi:uncharacterized protein ACA1_290170 [Acanthamoeba castellanii str. Neff]|uniref:SHSP domain-containing protein n=1 Tax=Acanthamoeba castellanii (strain ATCC 30010 / Neff) TaxID=1257118 RepID=L8HKQ3_ACACF|nr:uncharacterized protein ACA1_290170 [Acanthamoeba castellanii str. Neff]ELR25253.1 hypothetical protein ACA1_290170 [Acanthamoeba castellanii str. Neff]